MKHLIVHLTNSLNLVCVSFIICGWHAASHKLHVKSVRTSSQHLSGTLFILFKCIIMIWTTSCSREYEYVHVCKYSMYHTYISVLLLPSGVPGNVRSYWGVLTLVVLRCRHYYIFMQVTNRTPTNRS